MGRLILHLYLLALYIRPQDWWVPMHNLPIVDAIVGIALANAFLNWARSREKVTAPANVFVVLFLVLVFISNVANGTIGTGFEQLIVFLKRAAIFFIFLFIVDSTAQLKRVVSMIVILTTFIASQSVYQHFLGVGFAGQLLMKGRTAWVGMWDGPNVSSLIYVMALPFTFVAMIRAKNVLIGLWNFLLSSVLMYGVYLTNSRAGFLALLSVTFLTLFLQVKKGLRLIVAVLIFLLLYYVIASPFAPSRMQDLTTQGDSNRERMWHWETGLNLTRENPIIGVGKGRFIEYSYREEIAHNNYVQNMAEMGLIGFFVFIAIFYLSFKGLSKSYHALLQKGQDPNLASIAQALQISLAAFCIMTFFVNMELDVMFLWWGLCATVFAIAQRSVGTIRVKLTFMDMGWVCTIMLALMVLVWLFAVKEIV